MKITEIMTKKPIILQEEATVLEAVKKMENADCGILPVGSDNRHIKGVVTDRDIMTRAVAKNKNLSETSVKEVMSEEVIFCEEDANLQDAVQQMSDRNIRRILVKDKNEELSGILSLGDIIRRVSDKNLLADVFKETSIG